MFHTTQLLLDQANLTPGSAAATVCIAWKAGAPQRDAASGMSEANVELVWLYVEAWPRPSAKAPLLAPSGCPGVLVDLVLEPNHLAG